jgi:hypothetical protein
MRAGVARESVRAGKQFGGAFNKTFSAATKGLGKNSFKALQNSVKVTSNALKRAKSEQAAASLKLTVAENRVADAAGRVKIAQAQYAAAVKKFGADSPQAIAASERLAKAQRDHDVATQKAAAAQKVYDAALVKTAEASKLAEAAQAKLAASTSLTGKAFQVAAAKASQVGGAFKTAWAGNSEAATKSFSQVSGSLGGFVNNALQKAGGLGTGFGKAATITSQAWSKVFQNAPRWIQPFTGAIGESLSVSASAATKMGGLWASAFGKLGGLADSAFGKIGGLATKAFSLVAPGISKAGAAFGRLSAMAAPAISSIKSSFSSLTPHFQAVGGRIHGAMSASFSKMRTAGSKAFAGLKSVAASAGLAIAAVGAVALKKGWSRATGIESARASLKSLGFDAKQTEGMMKASLNSVKGTAFGLNDAAQAAGKLGGSIRDTDKMERSLKNVAAAAQLSGKDFGHISDIWAKWPAKPRLPALTWLSFLKMVFLPRPCLPALWVSLSRPSAKWHPMGNWTSKSSIMLCSRC